MIRHIVLIRFATATSAEERAAVFSGLAALRTAVPGILAYGAGENVSPEGGAKGYTHAFTFDFADAAARDTYLVHPRHVAAGKRLVAAADGGRDGLLIMDIEVER